MSVPSFWAKKVAASSPSSATTVTSASVTERATLYSAALSSVAFSRSSSPVGPMS